MSKITYADKVPLYENTDIADINKVKADDMNEIKNVVNANDDDINALSTYSTSEQRIGTWIDGKPVYRKVIQYSNRILAGNVEIPHGIHNFKMLAKIEIITFYDNKYYATPLIYNNVSSASYINYVDNTNIVLKLGENWDLYTMYITVEYTKTTD